MQTSQPNLDKDDIFSAQFWFVTVLVGIGAGTGGMALMKLLRTVQYLAWPKVGGSFLDDVTAASPAQRVLVLSCAGLITIIGVVFMRHMRNQQNTDISQAILYYNGNLPIGKSFFNAILSIVIVAMGAPLGREGAPKQVGAAIASGLARLTQLSTEQSRLLAACGAGAGMAAVYNVPIGGALFALEVLLGTFSISRTLPALAASFIATAISRIALPLGPTYSAPLSKVSLSLIMWALIIGPLLGLASTVYVRCIDWAKRQKPNGIPAIILTICIFSSVGVISIFYPQLLGNGKDVVQEAFSNQLTIPLICALLFLRPFATSMCLATRAPGGLFTPTMTFGALLGVALGHLWDMIFPGSTMTSYAIVGSGALLASATLGPISAIVLTLELTHRLDEIAIPLALAVIGSILVARFLQSSSIYSVNPTIQKFSSPN